MRSGLLSMCLLSLATTAAAPQTHLDELIARAKSLELDTSTRCSAFLRNNRAFEPRLFEIVSQGVV
jgi:hypothetical protein